jgi:hypothetical protein
MPRTAGGGQARGMNTRARTTAAVSGLLVLLGIALIAETAYLGGGIGYALGAVLTLAGAGRLYFSSK